MRHVEYSVWIDAGVSRTLLEQFGDVFRIDVGIWAGWRGGVQRLHDVEVLQPTEACETVVQGSAIVGHVHGMFRHPVLSKSKSQTLARAGGHLHCCYRGRRAVASSVATDNFF